MDDLDAFSLLDLPLELDHWLLDGPIASATGSAALIHSEGAPIALERTPSAPLATEAIDASDGLRATPAPTLTELKWEQEQEQEQERAPPAKRVRRGKSSSQRQKEEIASLREEASELQAQAARLRHVDPALTEENPCSVLALHGAGTHSVWVDIATRQHGEEKRAKEANAKLRDALATHAKFVRRLDRVLRKAEEWNHLALPAQADWLATEPSRDDREIFSHLARSVDEQVFPQLDGIMGRRWRLSLPDEVNDGYVDRLHSDACGARFTEHEDTKLLPFSHRMVDEVTWRSIRSGKLQFGLIADATITPAEDLLACQVCVRSALLKRALGSETSGIKMYLVLKRYQQADRVVYAWETLGLLPALEELHMSPARLTVRGWCESRPRLLRNGTEGCATRLYMQWCIRDHSDTKTLTDQGAVRIADMLMEEHTQSRAKIDQSLENLLLDEAVRRRKRKRAQ